MVGGEGGQEGSTYLSCFGMRSVDAWLTDVGRYNPETSRWTVSQARYGTVRW